MSSQRNDADGGTVGVVELLAAGFAAADQPVWAVDHGGLIRFVNAAAVTALGYARSDEMIGLDADCTIHHHDGPDAASECPLVRPRTTGETVTLDEWFVRRDGSLFRVCGVSAPIEIAGGRGAFLAFIDVEERPETDEALREREEGLADQLERLRRLATLVARGIAPESVFRAVADEVQALLGADMSALVRFEPDGTVSAMGVHGGPRAAGSRVGLDPEYVVAAVRETGQAARFDTDDPAAEGTPELARTLGIRSALAAPVVVDGQLWGALTVVALHRSLPAGAQQRLAEFTELMATAISNAQAREDLQRLADEQAALRRVATLVAREASQAEVFTAVAEEIGRAVGTDEVRMVRYEDDRSAVVVGVSGRLVHFSPLGHRNPLGGENATSRVFRTRQPVRIEDYDTAATGLIGNSAREAGLRCVVAVPVLVEGRLWGAMVAGTDQDEPLPPETEDRLSQFTELMATAIANAEARAEVERLAEEQAALRRVATLVAREASQTEVFATVAEEIGRLLGTAHLNIARYEDGRHAILVAAWGDSYPNATVGTRHPLGGENALSGVFRTSKPARVDYHAVTGTGAIGDLGRTNGMRCTVAVPVLVEGRLWGAMVTGTAGPETLPPETESRLSQFAELMATAIANSESRAEVEQLALEQAALQRVATLVAQGARPAEVFAAVGEEVGQLFGSGLSTVLRFDYDDPAAVVVGLSKELEPTVPVGMRWGADEPVAAAKVYRTGRSARWDASERPSFGSELADAVDQLGLVSTVASPIIVEGRGWGAVTVASNSERLPLDTGERLERFCALVATAIANTESRTEVERLAQEQAALRRVATLVAQGVPPAEIFTAVSDEVAGLFDTDVAIVSRFDQDGSAIVAVGMAKNMVEVTIGTRLELDESMASTTVYRTGHAARVDWPDWSACPPGSIAEVTRRLRTVSSVCSPIFVEGRLWGVVTVGGRQHLPLRSEERLEKFAQLVGTAIANADSRAELIASRARLVTASDEARRRFERDLHDGVQQRLVSLALDLSDAEAIASRENEELIAQLSRAGERLDEAMDELRKLSRGIHPTIVSTRGLARALKALAQRSAVPVELNLSIDEAIPEHVKVGAYYVVSEALTNAAKHAHASKVDLVARMADGILRLTISDNGVGGANPALGSGLTGLQDRVAALGGTIVITSPLSHGTSLRVALQVGQ